VHTYLCNRRRERPRQHWRRPVIEARPIPPKDAVAVADLARRATEARQRLPSIVQQIEDVVRRVDPIELLSQLTLLYQTHPADQQPNRDESAQWQVRIEWLTWLVFSRRIMAPEAPEIIDGRILGPLEELLSEYVSTVTMTLPEAVDGLSEEQNDVRSLIQLESIHVRGEAFQSQLEGLANELYSPHDEWCLANLGFTSRDAFVLARAIADRFSDGLHSLREAGEEIGRRLRADPGMALTLDLPPSVRNAFANGFPDSHVEEFANAIRMAWFFSKSPEIVGFAQDELSSVVTGRVDAGRVAAFLVFASTGSDAIKGEPNLLALAPTAKTPLIRHGDRYYLFVPGLLFEAIYYAFHRRLFADEAYRPTYDRIRAAWLERSAVEAFRKILPGAEAGWGLAYGPKQHRLDLDGLIQYDNKLILIECKWKSPTLLGLSGDVVAALRDVEGAILQPLAQAKRARDWIQKSERAEFVEKTSGHRTVVRRDEIAEVFLVTLVGSGAWALIAANLARLAPLGLFGDGEYPWALSVNDLRVVAECLELPSQLFDYLRRRYEVQRNPKFRFHDEWDLLGVYLAGALDVDDPEFAEPDLVAFDGFDSEIQDYYYSLSVPHVAAPKPGRPLPNNIRELLRAVERAHSPQKTDAICVVLSWPNYGLEALGKSLEQARKKAIWDGRAHAVALRHPWKSSGVTFACGYRNRRVIQEVLWRGCETQVSSSVASEWVGFGIDLASPWDPVVVYYNKARHRSEPSEGPKDE
jgi:hypothetical protein